MNFTADVHHPLGKPAVLVRGYSYRSGIIIYRRIFFPPLWFFFPPSELLDLGGFVRATLVPSDVVPPSIAIDWYLHLKALIHLPFMVFFFFFIH